MAGLPRKALTTSTERSKLMGRVRQSGTAPELEVRKLLRSLGYRFSTNGKGLPGSPDIVQYRTKKAIFVHGCFWHRHRGCKLSTMPKSNVSFWEAKFEQNQKRDERKIRQMRRLGFRVLVIWQCQLTEPRKLARLRSRIDRFFSAE